MIRMTILYPGKEGARFDWAYYLGTHIPLVRRRLGNVLKSISIEHGLAGVAPGAPAAFVALCHLTFDSMPAFQAAFASHAAELMADIPNYTAIEPVMQVSEVKV